MASPLSESGPEVLDESHPSHEDDSPLPSSNTKFLVNAALLERLPDLHYARFRYRAGGKKARLTNQGTQDVNSSSDHATQTHCRGARDTQHQSQGRPHRSAVPSLANRARWLAIGVGTPTATLLVARAMLAKLAPSLLVAVRSPAPVNNVSQQQQQQQQHHHHHQQANSDGHEHRTVQHTSAIHTSSSLHGAAGNSRDVSQATSARPNYVGSLHSTSHPDSNDLAVASKVLSVSSADAPQQPAGDSVSVPVSHSTQSHANNHPPNFSLFPSVAQSVLRSASLPAQTQPNLQSTPSAAPTSVANSVADDVRPVSHSSNISAHDPGAVSAKQSTPPAHVINSGSQRDWVVQLQPQEPVGDLWLFSARALGDADDENDDESNNDTQALLLLHEAFDIVEHGIWTGNRSSSQVPALLAALSDALHVSIENSALGLRLGSLGVYVPSAGLLYHLTPSLTSDEYRAESTAATTDVLIRVSLLRANRLSHFTPSLADSDHTKASPLRVVIAPLGIQAELVYPARFAGDSLTNSVLSRWCEAGLLPSWYSLKPRREFAVVFLRLKNGVSFPVPCACILALDDDGSSKSKSAGADSANELLRRRRSGDGRIAAEKNSARMNEAQVASSMSIWLGRKRPRSPPTDMEMMERKSEKELTNTAVALPDHESETGPRKALKAGASDSATKSGPAIIFAAQATRRRISVGLLPNAPVEKHEDESTPTSTSFNRALGECTHKPADAVLQHPLSCYLNPPPSPVLRTRNEASNDSSESASSALCAAGKRELTTIEDASKRESSTPNNPTALQRNASAANDRKPEQEQSHEREPSIAIPTTDFADLGLSSPDLMITSPAGPVAQDSLDSYIGGFDMDELHNFDYDVTQFFAAAESAAVPTSNASPVLAVTTATPVVSPAPAHATTVTEAPANPPLLDVDKASSGTASMSVSPTVPRSPPCTTAVLSGRLTLFDLPSTVDRPATPEREEQLRDIVSEEIASSLKARLAGSMTRNWRKRCYTMNPETVIRDDYRPVSKQVLPNQAVADNHRFTGSLCSVYSIIKKKKKLRKIKSVVRDHFIPVRRLRAFTVNTRRGCSASAVTASDNLTGLRKQQSDDSDPSCSDDDEPSVRGPEKTESTRPRSETEPNALSESVQILAPVADAEPTNSTKEQSVVRVVSPPRPVALTVADIARAAQNVSVDCAAACFTILYGVHRRNMFAGWVSMHRDERGIDSMSCVARDVVSSAGSSAVAHSEASSTVASHANAVGLGSGKLSQGTSVQNRAVSACSHSSNSRMKDRDSQRERDFAALYVLLQMQLIGCSEIQLFPDNRRSSPELRSVALREYRSDIERKESAHSTRSVSTVDDTEKELFTYIDLCPLEPNVLRRALFGLPHMILSGAFFTECLSDCLVESHNVSSLRAKANVVCPLPVASSGRSAVLRLSAPEMCVGFDGDWLETSSNILPLWEKSGLSPFAEPKNVQFAVLASKELSEDVRCFIRDVSAAYEESSLGKHSSVPFDPWMFMANSVSDPPAEHGLDPDVVTPAEHRMIQQFRLAATSLATKLTAVCKDGRKSDSIGPSFVIYVVCPFLRRRRAAIAALMRVLTPLVSAVPNSSVTSNSAASVPPSLQTCPWRIPANSETVPAPLSQSAFGSFNSASTAVNCKTGCSFMGFTVRVLPCEVVERYPTDKMINGGSTHAERSLRPQLVKAVAFAVYGNLRTRRMRRPKKEVEFPGLALSHESSVELLSPMTPDVVHVGSPSSSMSAPLSPTPSAHAEDFMLGSCGSVNVMEHGLSNTLYDPPYVLAGVGRHTGQFGSPSELVFHLAYTLCEPLSRYLYTWTDSRGETLDVAMAPVCTGSFGSRYRAFVRMWNRGQRWWLPYAENTCVTVAKLGPRMTTDEQEDWENVIRSFISSTNSRIDSQNERIRSRPRFPRDRACRDAESADNADVLKDAATPATPASLPASAALPPTSRSATAWSPGSLVDVAASTLRSVTVLTVSEKSVPELFAAEASEELAYVWGKEGACDALASMVVGVAPERSPIQVDVEMLLHFGHAGDTDDCPWDGADAVSILKHIVANFSALRYVISPPCWPSSSWRSPYPLHVEALRNMHKLASTCLPGVGR